MRMHLWRLNVPRSLQTQQKMPPTSHIQGILFNNILHVFWTLQEDFFDCGWLKLLFERLVLN
jgi:hypothetical protein